MPSHTGRCHKQSNRYKSHKCFKHSPLDFDLKFATFFYKVILVITAVGTLGLESPD